MVDAAAAAGAVTGAAAADRIGFEMFRFGAVRAVCGPLVRFGETKWRRGRRGRVIVVD